MINTKLETMLDFLAMAGILLLIASPFIYFHNMKKNIKEFKKWYADEIKKLGIVDTYTVGMFTIDADNKKVAFYDETSKSIIVISSKDFRTVSKDSFQPTNTYQRLNPHATRSFRVWTIVFETYDIKKPEQIAYFVSQYERDEIYKRLRILFNLKRE